MRAVMGKGAAGARVGLGNRGDSAGGSRAGHAWWFPAGPLTDERKAAPSCPRDA